MDTAKTIKMLRLVSAISEALANALEDPATLPTVKQEGTPNVTATESSDSKPI